MNKALAEVCEALKKISHQIKPQQPLSFLILTGKIHQGKTSLLRQSGLTFYPLEIENNANFFYNHKGIILELGESWLNQSEHLLKDSLKQLNRCHRNINITGIMLCIDSSELLLAEPIELLELCKSHAQLLNRFGDNLDYKVDVSLILTKLDSIAGFCEFFQADHETNLVKPLGFSLSGASQRKVLLENFRKQFDQMTEVLGQQIINKLHPARSSIKRTLIREFPLQLASLRLPIQSLIQNLSLNLFTLQAIYFTSAEQGGMCTDKLNRKIQTEYALTIQDSFPQSHNYRPYFIEGAIHTFQDHTKHLARPNYLLNRWSISLSLAIISFLFLGIIKQYISVSKLLDDTSKELISYENLLEKGNNKALALYHLSLAATKLQHLPTATFTMPTVEQLKQQIYFDSKHFLYSNFLPELLTGIEKTLLDTSQPPVIRYQALKIYIMLAKPQYYSEKEVIAWFKNFWQKRQEADFRQRMMLLTALLKQPRQAIAVNNQIISEVRNYLNALPTAYLYYTLAKNNFPTQQKSIQVEGFELPSSLLPYSYTRSGFKEIFTQLPSIITQLRNENWVLARQDLANLQPQLEEAYCFDYVTWWQNFIRRTKPVHYQNYHEGLALIQTLSHSKAITKLIHLIQQHTAPDNTSPVLFNHRIANEFAYLNLISFSTLNHLTQNISELEGLLSTLSLVNAQKQTVFNLTKARFQGNASDSLSNLYNKIKQVPEPIATWARQIADDTWTIFINESKAYLNELWQNLVYKEYQANIAARYPLDSTQTSEITIPAFEHFFSPHGTLTSFTNNYLKPFLDSSTPQWQPKEVNGYLMPISNEITDELIRGNVITNMFFSSDEEKSNIEFSLQKINLDPVITNLQLVIGKTILADDQSSDSFTQFSWPQNDAKLSLISIEGNHYELKETGPWAFFKILQKVNVLVDSEDSTSLQILFEVNGNSGRYVLKTQNQINPFSPGILAGFNLKQEIA